MPYSEDDAMTYALLVTDPASKLTCSSFMAALEKAEALLEAGDSTHTGGSQR